MKFVSKHGKAIDVKATFDWTASSVVVIIRDAADVCNDGPERATISLSLDDVDELVSCLREFKQLAIDRARAVKDRDVALRLLK